MSAYNDIETNEFFCECWQKMKERLAEVERQKEPLKKEAELQKKIIADEEARLLVQKTTNAWKRKGAPVVSQKESVNVSEARVALMAIETKLLALESNAAKQRAQIEDIETTIADNEEFRYWSEAMQLNLSQPLTHKPALLVKFEKREAEELADKLAKTDDWARLPLDHQSAEGKAKRDAFYDVGKEVVEVVETPFVEEVEEEEEPVYRKKLPWWYAKYNIPVDV